MTPITTPAPSSSSTMALTEKDLRKVRDFLFEVRLKWYDIGIELDMEQEELDVIKQHNHNEPSKCLSEMVTSWLKSYDNPTWQALAGALESRVVNEKKLAKTGICFV